MQVGEHSCLGYILWPSHIITFACVAVSNETIGQFFKFIKVAVTEKPFFPFFCVHPEGWQHNRDSRQHHNLKILFAQWNDEIWCSFWMICLWGLSTLWSRGQNKEKIPVSQSEQNKLKPIHLQLTHFFSLCTRKFSHISIVLLDNHVRETLRSYASDI